jgi:XTP/dITP diphosphohydrolase
VSTPPDAAPPLLILASNNPGKLREIRACLADSGLTVMAQGELGVPEADETAHTFLENALLKARNAAARTGLAALADDSGIAVAALGGAPGVYSALYAGRGASDAENLQALLAATAHCPDEERHCAYHCVLVYLRHAADPTPLVCQGVWHGTLLRAPRGTGGFGYDPIFWVPERGCSAAELSAAEKNALSHRGQALRALRAALATVVTGGP